MPDEAQGTQFVEGLSEKVEKNPTDRAVDREFEAKLWAAADALRNNMDAAEYKHVVLGLIFLKYISDAFEAKHAELEAQKARGRRPGRPATNTAPTTSSGCRRKRAGQHLKASAPQPTIGKLVDDAMVAIERDNPSLKGVLPKDYARPGLDKQRLGQLIDLVSDIGLGSAADRSKDMLGRVYEYFLAQFASAEGKKRRPVLHASHVVRVLVEMLAPYKGRVYDPCCGSGGMFVQQREVHRGARRQARRHLHLRPGVELHHLAAGQDEPRHPRHRRADRATATPSTTTCTPT